MKRLSRAIVLYIMMEKKISLNLKEFAKDKTNIKKSTIYNDYNNVKKGVQSYNFNGHVLKGYIIKRNDTIHRYDLISDQSGIIYPLNDYDPQLLALLIFRLIEDGVQLNKKAIKEIFGIEKHTTDNIIAAIKLALKETKTIYDYNILEFDYSNHFYRLTKKIN